MTKHPTVLIFAGNDPSGGAGIAADIMAITAQGAHPLPILTALTVQDNNHVYAVHPVGSQTILDQATRVLDQIEIRAIKIGIVGNYHNACAMAKWIKAFLHSAQKNIPVILDPVLSSGQGDSLSTHSPLDTIMPLLEVATLITPNTLEAQQLSPGAHTRQEQAEQLIKRGIPHVLIKGGHDVSNPTIVNNSWFSEQGEKKWSFKRQPYTLHGSGCTLASAISAYLARGIAMEDALTQAQHYTQSAIQSAYAIASGQCILNRQASFFVSS